jgi:hypothetical protein
MKKIVSRCAIVLTTLLLTASVAGCRQPPASYPPSIPTPTGPLDVRTVPTEAYYLPGEPVKVKFSISNVSSNPVTLDPYPPEMPVSYVWQDEVVFSKPAGTQHLEIEPGDTTTLEFLWDQKDKNGKQVPPGWYFVPFSGYGINAPAFILIQYPQGAMEKTIEPNESQTVNGITVTLERIDLGYSGMKVYAVGKLSGYPVPPGISTTYVIDNSSAEYSVDGGVVKQAGSAGIQYLGNGTRLLWDRYVDPIPSDAKELVFRISTIALSLAVDRPDELVKGPWEFEIPLE